MPAPLSITRAQAQEIDRRAVEDYGVPSIVLMENAGRQVADHVQRFVNQQHASGQVVICCGTGNNGGDGLVIARHLDLRGLAVQVVLCGDAAKLKGDAKTNFDIVRQSAIPLLLLMDGEINSLQSKLAGTAVIVDALLGTGMRGDPRSPMNTIIHRINRSGLPVLSVDLPSGLDCDSGQPGDPTIQATGTYTFVAYKQGFSQVACQGMLGQVEVLDIGAPRRLLEEMLG